jgi:hypothetical protein
MHKSIVRAAMAADILEEVGEMFRYENEEYGDYIYQIEGSDEIYTFSFAEDEAFIESYRDAENFEESIKDQYGEALLASGDNSDLDEVQNTLNILKYLGREGSEFYRKLRNHRDDLMIEKSSCQLEEKWGHSIENFDGMVSLFWKNFCELFPASEELYTALNPRWDGISAAVDLSQGFKYPETIEEAEYIREKAESFFNSFSFRMDEDGDVLVVED